MTAITAAKPKSIIACWFTPCPGDEQNELQQENVVCHQVRRLAAQASRKNFIYQSSRFPFLGRCRDGEA